MALLQEKLQVASDGKTHANRHSARRANYTSGDAVPSLPPAKTAAKWAVAWVISNIAWTFLSGAAGALVSGLLKGLDVLANPYALVGVGFLVAAVVASLPGVARRGHGKVPRLRVVTAPKSVRLPSTKPPPMQADEGEAQRIAASRDDRLAAYRTMPTPRGRLEAHAGRGKEILARIDKASEDFSVPLVGGLAAQAKAMESAQRQATVLISDRDGWIATATGLVEQLAPNLLDEYKTDYVVRTPRVTAGVFHDLREPLRQRLDGLQRVIDAMGDQ